MNGTNVNMLLFQKANDERPMTGNMQGKNKIEVKEIELAMVNKKWSNAKNLFTRVG
jgi:hypothetical protein